MYRFDIGQNAVDGMQLIKNKARYAGVAMSRFVVRFMKDVLGENGREAEICQSSMEIDAANEGDARELAKKLFCETQSLCDWSLHADRIQVKAADFPS
jgi:hypothetical protein